jgi:hypothetical protein
MGLIGRYFYLKALLLINLSICLFPVLTKAQPTIKDIQVWGSSVQFIYSTLSQYETTGIKLDGKTTLRLRCQYTGQPNWQLILYALDNAIAYEGDPLNNIPLGNLKITVPSPPGGVIVTAPFTLDTDNTHVFLSGVGGSGAAMMDVTVTISYELPTMLNKPEGFYYVALYFLLKEAP